MALSRIASEFDGTVCLTDAVLPLQRFSTEDDCRSDFFSLTIPDFSKSRQQQQQQQ